MGFGTEEFNYLPLIQENAPTKKIRWARKVEQTSSIDLLLFADDTTSFCRRSNMQNRKEILKKTFKNWKLNLNDDKWEPSRRVTQRSENHSGRKWTKHQGYSVNIGMPWVLFHHNQQKRLMAAKKTWFKLSRKLLSWALSKKLEGQIATAVVGATLLFGCEVRGFSRKEREFEALWSRVVFGMTRQKRGELEQEKKTWADLRIMCRMKPINSGPDTRQLNYLASLARLPDDRLEKIALRGHLIPEHTIGTRQHPKTQFAINTRNSSVPSDIWHLKNCVQLGSMIGKDRSGCGELEKILE